MTQEESALRGAYLFGNVRNCLSAGQPTWASLEAYHCSLVFVAPFSGSWVSVLCVLRIRIASLIFFRQGPQRIHKGGFAEFLVLTRAQLACFFASGEALSSRVGCGLFSVRTLRVATLPASLERTKNVILNLDGGFGRSRNDILYRNQSWPFSPDLQWPLSMLDINDNLFSYTDRDGSSFPLIAMRIFVFAN